jgi:catechol 2,3-dioxygenase-like lactoylglutathione lyase family enzyme
MPLEYLEHFLIQTSQLQATRDWYVDVLGMREGWHPDFKFPVVWLYLGDRDVLHLTEGGPDVSRNRLSYLGQQSTETQGTGVVDHVAFRCSGLQTMIQHLRARNIVFNERMVSDQGLYQLFLFDPNGVKVELNFANAEAIRHGIEPPLKASYLSN